MRVASTIAGEAGMSDGSGAIVVNNGDDTLIVVLALRLICIGSSGVIRYELV